MEFATITPEFIADLYSAAVEPDGFKGLANLVSYTAGAKSGAIWVVENGNVRDISITDAGQESLESYVSYFHKVDVWQSNIVRMQRDEVYIGYEHTPEPELLRTEFYNDFCRKFGMFRPMGATVQLRPGTIATISLERLSTTLLFEDHDKRNFQRFIPHVKAALQLGLRQRDDPAQGQTYAAALDALAFGSVICTARGEILFANAAAESLARAGAGIVLGRRGRGAGALIAEEARRLTGFIHNAATGGPGGILRLTAGDGKTGLLVLITPLPRSLYEVYGPAHALVSLRSPWDRPSFAEATLSALFGLSPAQAAIALALHAGKSPEQIAAERRVRISTLRTHLADIFARTGTDNQRDLLRLMGLVPPVR